MTIYNYPGSISIDQLQTEIRYTEQNNNQKLVKCEVATDDQNMPSTKCYYDDVILALGESLNPLFIVMHGGSKPAGTTSQIFKNIIIMANKSLISVDFYR
ncbi:MAG: hypothetical protein WC762_02880 [Methylobacter sp.]